ncbi:MAG: ATP-dependent helicase, partial [Clostridiales bacterium]|nr:ATP-dependent helicase [Clostridiales bacterium]
MKEADFLREFRISLDEQQLAAMRAAGRHTLLLAVPGSGKTTVITARTGYMLFCRGIDAQNILTVTFSRSAAQEMRRRFRETFSVSQGEMPAFRTIHSLCRGILLSHCRETDTSLPELLTERQPLIRQLYLRLFPDAEYPDDALLRQLDSRITYIKNMLLAGEKIDAIEQEGIDFPTLYRAYEAANREAGRMDFDDQLLMAYRLLRKDAALLGRLRAQYPYINVDEAQDTSYIQHRILYLLASPGELFMVGDEDQSIYGFRAAYPEIFLRFLEIYPGAQLL